MGSGVVSLLMLFYPCSMCDLHGSGIRECVNDSTLFFSSLVGCPTENMKVCKTNPLLCFRVDLSRGKIILKKNRV